MLNDVINTYFLEQQFSNRYLSYKYILQMLSLYLNRNSDLNYGILLKILGKMPLEFFSNQTILNDTEGQMIASRFIDRFGLQQTSDLIASYLHDMF